MAGRTGSHRPNGYLVRYPRQSGSHYPCPIPKVKGDPRPGLHQGVVGSGEGSRCGVGTLKHGGEDHRDDDHRDLGHEDRHQRSHLG